MTWKNIFLFLFGFCCSSALWGQSISELEKQLSDSKGASEKLAITSQLAKAYLSEDVKKALDLGKQANRLATDQGNKAMSAQTAFVVAQAYEYMGDERNQEVWLKSAQTYAQQAGDSDLVIRSVEKRSALATRERKYQRAVEINQEAFKYFSQKGTSISELEQRYAIQKASLEREKRQLESERASLQTEIDRLTAEKDQLSSDKTSLETRQEELVKQKEQVEKEITRKDEKLATIEEEKQKVEAIAAIREQEVHQLSRDTLEKRYMLAEASKKLAEEELKAQQRNSLLRLGGFGLLFMFLLAALLYGRFRAKQRSARQLQEKNKLIEAERERSDSLLLNILPKPIAEELKTSGKARTRYFEEVSILFTDFVNFTAISEQLSPEELVEELDKCFKAFDGIISKYPDIEKIKTIGDAYMCATGLNERRTLPLNMIRAAMEIQSFLEAHRAERELLGKPYFSARIGIHTGPAVAGVVGVKKFAYDIWGDTVNIAARIEANCEPGRVNISASTYNLIKYAFECQHRGKVHAKNKGDIDMYYVVTERSAVAV